jgi:pseudouridine-5'-phosphate glycosidase
MEALDQVSTTLALTMRLAWASGINLYATLFTLGYLASTGNIDLPADLQIVAHPMVM